MKTKVRLPSHLCPKCGEWWMVEPVEHDLWRVIRYGEHIRYYTELVIEPVCPACAPVVLKPWMLEVE